MRTRFTDLVGCTAPIQLAGMAQGAADVTTRLDALGGTAQRRGPLRAAYIPRASPGSPRWKAAHLNGRGRSLRVSR